MTNQAGTAYTILYLPNEILGICHNFLGPGHFVFIAPVCKRFKTVYLTHVSDEKITTGESCTSSISRARPYFAHKGKLSKRLALFWWFNTRYGRLGVMEWAHRRGYSRIWQKQVKNADCTFGPIICSRAAKYGQLDVLRWLRQKLPLGSKDLSSYCSWWSSPCPPMGEIEWLCLESWYVHCCCSWWASLCSPMGEKEWVRLE